MKFFIDVVYDSLLKQGEELCGDKVEIVRDDTNFTFVLADGLGSGVKANILATLTSKIIATMMSEGATLEEAIATITSTLPVCKERNLAYSTFSCVHIDQHGMTHLAEFDNPFCLVYRDQQCMPLDREMVLIDDKKVYLSSFQGQEQDFVVVFSDGVVHAGVGRLLDLGWMYDNVVEFINKQMKSKPSIRKVLRDILVSVMAFYLEEPGDDSTACVIQYKKRVTATVMIGPPQEPTRDGEVVEELMKSTGYKIVCGGTTSQIVARYLKEEVLVELEYDTPSLPPTATIKQIDLVTEGVLTIAKTVQLLQEMNTSESHNLSSVEEGKKDGAHKLARMLRDECTEVCFLVGRAMNPAHQNIDIPISLNMKLQLVKECMLELEKMGKTVIVKYY